MSIFSRSSKPSGRERDVSPPKPKQPVAAEPGERTFRCSYFCPDRTKRQGCFTCGGLVAQQSEVQDFDPLIKFGGCLRAR